MGKIECFWRCGLYHFSAFDRKCMDFCIISVSAPSIMTAIRDLLEEGRYEFCGLASDFPVSEYPVHVVHEDILGEINKLTVHKGKGDIVTMPFKLIKGL